MTDEQITEPPEPDAAEVPEEAPQHGVGPFTVRELILLAIWLVAFVVSFFPVYTEVLGRALGGGRSVWTAGLDWILTIGVPTVAVFLIVLRRFSPDGIRRVGSLGIDQFASVAFSVSATVWLVSVWHDVAVVISDGVWVRTWVVWAELVLMLAGVVLTVLAPVIPPFEQDFRGRREIPAHRSARPVRALTPRPPRPKPEPVAQPTPGDLYGPPPVAQEPAPTGATAAYEALGFPAAEPVPEPAAAEEEWAPHYSRSGSQPEQYGDTGGYRRTGNVEQVAAAPEPARPVHQAFWALAPVERDVYDEHGVPIFRVGPTAWALVIEDRGSLFVIRHDDGRIGYLHDVSGVTRG